MGLGMWGRKKWTHRSSGLGWSQNSSMAKSRRTFLAGGTALAVPATAVAQEGPKKVHYKNAESRPERRCWIARCRTGTCCSSAGKGARTTAIKAHTEDGAGQYENKLQKAGSWMEKCLKCNVYLEWRL